MKHPSAQVVSRHLSDAAISHIDEDLAVSMRSRIDQSEEGPAAWSDALIQELDRSDIVVIGTPMHRRRSGRRRTEKTHNAVEAYCSTYRARQPVAEPTAAAAAAAPGHREATLKAEGR